MFPGFLFSVIVYLNYRCTKVIFLRVLLLQKDAIPEDGILKIHFMQYFKNNSAGRKPFGEIK
jgi:hypothetical protein